MKLADTSIKRPVFTTMIILAIITYGLIAYNKIGIDLFPNIEFPVITVTTIYKGADPETVEIKISKKIEDAVNQVSMVKMLRSSSLQNVSQVVVMFELEKDIDVAAQEVRDKITTIMRDLPADIEQPIVQKIDLGAMPVLTFAVSGDESVTEVELFKFADRVVKQQFQKIQGVGNVKIVGGRDRVIWIYIDPEKLIAHHLTPEDVAKAAGGQNIEIPAGNFLAPGQEIAVKTKGNVTSVEELRNIALTNFEGSVIKLKDVATIEDGLEEQKSSSKLDRKSTISVVVTKQAGMNTVEMARKIRKQLPEIQALAPQGVEVKTVVDNAVFIENSIEHAMFDLELGGILAVLIIGIFLRNLRMTLIAAVAIPASVIGTFAAIKLFGFTLNFLTLLGLSLSVGLLVDDAIVVLENIFRHFEEHGDRKKASHEATDEIGLAVMATTFSLVAVFFPIATTSGMVGKFLKEFGITVAVSVLISLFVSFTLTPMLSSRIMKEPADNFFTKTVERILNRLDRLYGSIISWSLNHRAVIIGIALITLGFTVYLGGFLPKEMIPQMDQAEFLVNIESPPGSSMEYTQQCVDEVAEILKERKDVLYMLSTIGGGFAESKELASINVKLASRNQRELSQQDIMQEVRERLKNYNKASVTVQPRQPIEVGMSNAVIQLNLLGSDLNVLDGIAKKLIKKMNDAGGYTDIELSYKPAKPELGIAIDRDRAAMLGIPAAMVGQTMRILLAGMKVSEYKEAGDMYDVNIRLSDKYRGDLDIIRRMPVRSPSGTSVELKNIIKTQTGTSPQEITRLSGQRAITVYANPSKEKALGIAVEEMDNFLKDEMPQGYSSKMTGQADFMKENFEQLFAALFLGIAMIYFILASQFESFLHPFTIMFSLPFSIIGAVSGLLIAGKFLSILSMIGFIMLMGLVTKNAILLIDFANRGKEKGMELNDAIVRAGTIRLRPILMTTFAMIFGMLPIAMGTSLGSEVRAPMAIAVVGGLITSTFLTLIVVPVMYNIFESVKKRIGIK
jgi:HAE1 family hydrophobic/amphiphilic exporter-1